jgi:hypothetical protein
VAWDLRYPALDPVGAQRRGGDDDDEDRGGAMAAPGVYTVTLSKEVDGKVTDLAGPMEFKVERMREGALEGASPEEVAAFWKELAGLNRSVGAASLALRNALRKVDAMGEALSRTPAAPGDLDARLHALRQSLLDLDERMNGNPAKRQVGEKTAPTVRGRLRFATGAVRMSTYGPTPNVKHTFELARSEFAELRAALDNVLEVRIPEMEKALQDAGAPWMEGQPIPE